LLFSLEFTVYGLALRTAFSRRLTTWHSRASRGNHVTVAAGWDA
jgi:hypothetical protein